MPQLHMENTDDNLDRHNLPVLWEVLKCLVTPATIAESAESDGLLEAFSFNLQKAITLLGYSGIEEIPRQGRTLECGTDLIWNYVESVMFVVLQLKNKIQEEDISVSQRKSVRSSLQFVVSMGVLPNIMPRIISRTTNPAITRLLEEHPSTVMQKYERLCVVVKFFLCCCDSSCFRSLVISNSAHELLAALFQLSFGPVKKPDAEITSPNNNFIMTTEIWSRIEKDQTHFRSVLSRFVMETYQPKIMLELMILQGYKKDHSPPLWLKKSISSILTSCLIQPGGIASLIQATFDSAPDSGADWIKTDVLARIVTSPSNHYDKIATQLLKLIEKADESGSNDMNIIIVACIKQLFEKDAALCQNMIIGPLLLPLGQIHTPDIGGKEDGILLKEEEIESLIKVVHKCFASSGSNVSNVNLPATIILPHTFFFYKLFCKVNGSVSLLCRYIEDILYRVLCDRTQKDLEKILKCLLLEENQQDMYLLPPGVDFIFGANGGVSLSKVTETSRNLLSSAVENSGDSLMSFLDKKNDCELSLSVFEVLLKMMVQIGMKPSSSHSTTLGTMEDTLASLMLASEKHLGIVRLLAALVENPNVRQKLCDNPGPILAFIVNLFETLAPESASRFDDDDLECIFVSFMILNVILDSCGEDTNWSLFTKLLCPVSVIRDNTKNDELKRLASRVFTIISTSGAISDNNLHQQQSKKTSCEEALHDACDPLLPVRGHALLQLARLLQKRDKETLDKKNAVLCLFKENLSNSDSYIYLAAINGMVAFAAFEPEEAVHSLTKEYISISKAGDSSRDAELRMKVGEILVKLVRELGPVASKYRNELLNAFLVGAKDVDHLMRASSLSNLGEVCQILGFRVGPILQELLVCVQSTLHFDKALEPRRASIMVVTQLLRGLDASSFSVLQEAALQLYRCLKKVYCEDEDDIVRLHAQLALEELGKLAEDIIFPKISMEKKIHILP
ncbi:Transport and Golgi organization protein 6-like protein [Frankliniella fusca]|uniref:Transport and Golgi organization protein 6-like protein n=1 Tax=Frankliniella fusca TaxID=407009 RepID=A0AAE1HHQ8_9NEOP|nr:Transport and Golgi organization protein 6-like protein [Frankliniella fusca]